MDESKIVSEIMGGAKAPPSLDRPLKEGEYDLGEWFDADLLAVEPIYQWANKRISMSLPVDLDAFTREVKERFHKAGFWVDVKWWQTNIPGVSAPDFEIYARTSPQQVDYDQQVYDVSHNTLDLDEG